MTKIVTKRPSFQGDLMIRRIAKLPAGAKLRKAEAVDDAKHVLAHSETGHHHVIDSRNAQMLIDDTNAFIGYLEVMSATEIEHLRSFDRHESLIVEPGIYEIRRQREYVPEGWRRAAD